MSAMEKALSRRLAREAAESEVVRSAASKISYAERAKSDVVRQKDSEPSEVSPSTSVGPATPEKSSILLTAETVAREGPFTTVPMVEITEVTSALDKSQTYAQEMSDYVTKLAEEIKQLRTSRAREETARAKEACDGGAQ